MSIKDDDQPKIINNSLISLEDNESYLNDKNKAPTCSSKEVSQNTDNLNSESNPMSPLAMYLSLYAASGQEAVKKTEKQNNNIIPPSDDKIIATPSKIFIRVENMQCESFLKAKRC